MQIQCQRGHVAQNDASILHEGSFQTFGSHSTELSITAKWHMKTWYSENAILQKRNFSEPAVSDQNINAIRQAQDVLFFSTSSHNSSKCKEVLQSFIV